MASARRFLPYLPGQPWPAQPAGGHSYATLAKLNADAVLAAYPEAEVTGTPGVNGLLVDWLLGIQVKWTYDGYTHTIHVGMRIYEPLTSLPTVEQTHVQDLEMVGYRDRGVRRLYAWTQILDEY